ncbi:carbohydrate ABC transporter permease [Paenibacillus spongiae]|uniref:Carbohydrate ABC transporter permease n=1 Tax=Paenibacillus spongiae TaxID=2909671 RepID=A0ABY5S9N8_9BACL|nr:carbohydrate ABC transporter permease [Paenibacillus spongiae]UVI30651.1 carbohydrate ABC transporter permease [Paenibacillus spongiae]
MNGSRRASFGTEIALLFVSLLFLLPVLYLATMSFKEPRIFYKPLELPDRLYLDYYKEALGTEFFRSLLNSLLVTAGGLALTIFVASMAGYVLARRKERVFQLFFYLFMSGMIIPTVGSLIPLFKLATFLHLINTRTLLVLLYTAGFIPFASFLYSAFTKSIPRELEESANIDGCGSLRMFWVIIFPLLLPATGTFILTNVYGVWNDFLTPLIFLNSPEKMTLMPMIVQFMFNKQSINFGPVFAISVLAMLPLLLMFVLTQKHMLRGLVMGSVKG